MSYGLADTRCSQCNGLKPCHTCIRRKLTCSYTSNNADYGLGESGGSPTKRRHIEASPPSINAALDGSESSPTYQAGNGQSQSWDEDEPNGQSNEGDSATSTPIVPATAPVPVSAPQPTSAHEHARKTSTSASTAAPVRSNANGQSEETTIYTETRMLQDQTGRLLYIGDASTLSILQLIRIIVENTAGAEIAAPFIEDPKRFSIMENIIKFPENTRIPSFLPDKETTDILVESYFTNTCGLMEVFDKTAFINSVNACYKDQLLATNFFLCHLYLVLALGLLFATPIPGSREEIVIQKQLASKLDRAELFFRSARSMSDPGAGFEDADFWSIQALSLMTVYMLAVSKRNTAYAYLGMAVRSAYALGLHREETMNAFIFTPAEMKIRRNMWKTLFILDRFLAATLGRPTAISEDDCSCEIMPANDVGNMTLTGKPTDAVHAQSLNACVRACHVIGITLRVFSQRKISTSVVQDIADMSKDWERGPRANLQGRRLHSVPMDPAQGIATLHVNLLSLHSLILLTRQLFVMHNWKLTEQRSGLTKAIPTLDSPIAKYSEACVIASYQTVQLVQRARDARYLPQRNPFVIYFLFVASLIVFMNQFASLYYTDAYEKTASDAIALMEYCAESDPQAQRVLEIMHRFSIVVSKWTRSNTYEAPPLSEDLSNLYSQAPSPELRHAHANSIPIVSSPHDRSSVMVKTSRQSSMSSPTGPRLPVSELLIPHPSASVRDTRMNGMSPPQMTPHSLPPLANVRPSVSSHPVIDNSDLNGDIEFDFGVLWENYIGHVAPVSAVLAGPSNPAPHFPASILGSTSDPYAAHPLSPESRISPRSGIGANIPLFHSSNFG
ncbi:fungal-specific transcription factor domain-containing protein [Lasiosphaeria ovina]|uniref:Fungal-specific transcription factor domain-containing protein n=1 Tax=Lasiosphaeria ovina TaxID=92902 RepID=A0AAE0NES5_9PEZI|nr:fungal-specific transcription factor domain-containing protein [Lasiosphaeria ovina]